MELIGAVQAIVKGNDEATSWPWDAVVLDQTMVTLNGLETLKQLPCAFKKHVPIIMYSTEDSLLEDYMKHGAVGYMEKKPGSHKNIVERLKELAVPLQ